MHRLSRVIQDIEEASDDPRLVALDDLLNEAYAMNVSHIFTKVIHHRTISVILINQDLFQSGRFSRDISRNAKYLVVFKNVRDKNNFAYVARQVYPKDSNGLYESCLDTRRRPYAYLLLDLAKDKDDLRITMVQFPVDDEKDTFELSPLTSVEDISSRL